MSCPDCFTGTVHEGTPVGRVETIHGLPTYVAGTTSETEPEGIIVIISDAFGWDLLNSRILADAYAKRGNYTVYLPDFMDGNLMPLDPTNPAMANARHAGHLPSS
jgi:putative IMPACT (imprinted ancient) family translation regulator